MTLLAKQIANYFSVNTSLISFLYSRETDVHYSAIRTKSLGIESYVEIESELIRFYNVRLEKAVFRHVLKMADSIPLRVEHNDRVQVFKHFYEKFSEVTGRKEVSYTSKLLNLRVQSFPIFDSRVLHFLRRFGYDRPVDNIVLYTNMLELYDSLLGFAEFRKPIDEIRKTVYSLFELREIDEFKFIDTLMYSISNGKELERLHESIQPIAEKHLEHKRRRLN